MSSLKVKSSGTITPSVVVDEIWLAWEKLPESIKNTQSRLIRALFCDIAQHFPNFALYDFSYLMTRYASEGDELLLRTLPLLGKAVETGVITDQGFIIPDGWRCYRKTRLPKFCYSLMSRLFHDDGSPRVLLHIDKLSQAGRWNADAEDNYSEARSALKHLRRLLLAWSKVEAKTILDECSNKSTDEFITRVTKDFHFTGDPCILSEARRLLKIVFEKRSSFRDELMDFQKNPWGRHGPGAVAGREVGCEKWSFNHWPGLSPRLTMWREGLECKFTTLGSQPDARLCMVPKDFRGPRLICIEPKENQFAQQGIMDILYRLVERHPLTRRSISFCDTEESRRACFDYRYGTIDLKDASDTIHLVLARLLLPRWVFRLVTRYRSRGLITPKGRIVPRCLATMGNATCFPLETLIFWALSLGTLITIRDSHHPRIQRYLNLDIRVFGDDIIVPLWGCEAVARTLEATGLTVNTHKTCSFSPVRESCGQWVFAGEAIKIVRFRSVDVVDYRSYLQWQGLLKDLGPEISALQVEISQILEDFEVSMRKSFPKAFSKRYNKNLMRWEIYAPKIVQSGRLRELVDAAGLYAWYVHNDRTPFLKGARKRVKMGWQVVP